ncbi:hypothetical protein [Sediminicola sp. 1XM1-17]|uniref:hypothetical protein n=1 Tax=Sediminicola sp. 1XM1-17 TaxID=3127702 RepID=UPI003076B36A
MWIYELILSRFYQYIKGDRRYVYYKKLRSNLGLSRNNILNEQNKAICSLVKHAYENTTYYKELFDNYQINPDDIRTKEDLNRLPPLTKQNIKDNINDLKSNDRHGQSLRLVTSGGSTGELGIIYRSKYFEEMSRASWLRNNAMIGWMPTDKTVWFWTSPTEHATFFKMMSIRLGQFINRRIYLNAFEYSADDFPIWYKRIIKFKPKVVFGNPSLIIEFAHFLKTEKLDLPSVKIVVTTTEKLKGRNFIEEVFNCPVYDQYGCSEIIAIGIELDKNEMVFTDDVVLVNANADNQFLLTALYSYGFPLLNYKVGDVGELMAIDRNDKRYPFPKINLKIGRITDKFLSENKTTISTSSLGSYLATLDLGIKEHQIIQSDYKVFKINYVILDNTNLENYFRNMTLGLEEYFGTNLTIVFNKVLSMPIEKSGKRLMFKRTFNL